MHFFVILLIILLNVALVGMVVGAVYLSSQSSSKQLLNQVQFSRVSSTFGNGLPPPPGGTAQDSGQLWAGSNSVLAKLSDLRTFLALAEWGRDTTAHPIPSPNLQMFFTLPEPATSVRTYLVASVGVLTGNNNNLKGVLISPIHMALEFAHDEEGTGVFFTGNNVANSALQEIGIVIIYTID